MRPEAVLLASFGVADDAARKMSIDRLFDDLGETFAGSEMRQAFTSNFMRECLAAKGIRMDSLDAALAALAEEGVRNVLVQPTHLTRGEEYEKKICAAVGMARSKFDRLALGETLLGGEADFAELLAALRASVSAMEGHETVLLGHGSPHRHNPVYARFQSYMDKRNVPIHVGVLEENDMPDFSTVLHRLQSRDVREIVLAPLLFSGGRHVTDDMAGDDKRSWKSRFEAEGIRVHAVCKGLGEHEAIRRIYVGKAQRAWRDVL